MTATEGTNFRKGKRRKERRFWKYTCKRNENQREEKISQTWIILLLIYRSVKALPVDHCSTAEKPDGDVVSSESYIVYLFSILYNSLRAMNLNHSVFSCVILKVPLFSSYLSNDCQAYNRASSDPWPLSSLSVLFSLYKPTDFKLWELAV